MEHEIPFGNSTRENGTTFLDFPLFVGIFQWDEPTKRVPFTAEPEIPEILSKWKAPPVSTVSARTPGTMTYLLCPKNSRGGGVLPEKLGGVSGTLLETLTLFQTKIYDFPSPVSDVIKI